MTLTELTPDIALKALLDGLQMQVSADDFVDVKVYGQAETPNVGLDDAFVAIGMNGMITSLVKPIGMYKGNVAVAINVKCYDDGTANAAQIKQLIKQVEGRCSCKTSQGFFFEFYEYAVITPTTTNITNGYATTVLNLAWHTIHR